MNLGQIYNYLVVELSDPRTREWPMISSPFPIMLIILGYLYLVLYAGPRYMKDQQSYKLKTFMLCYDIIQILMNLWMIKGHLSAGWFTEYNIWRKPLNTDNPNALKLFNLIWWLLLLKLFDFVETYTFVLRKKQNQVSVLHVYHHIFNVFFGWYYLKYGLDERMTLVTLMNCVVHVIMYTYYLCAAWSPKFQKTISPIKLYISKIQMVQFGIMIIYGLQFINPNYESKRTRILTYILLIHCGILLYLFYDFYKKTYTKVSKLSKKPKQKNN